MEEEIDIIELLKRVKEGKAPKKIELGILELDYNDNAQNIESYYLFDNGSYERSWLEYDITLDTKIKILDKPIIEELDENENVDIYELTRELSRKVNQIIRYLNKEEK